MNTSPTNMAGMVLAALILAVATGASAADAPPPPPAASAAPASSGPSGEVTASSGAIEVPGARVVLNLDSRYRFVDAAGLQRLYASRGAKFPFRSDTLGMILPSDPKSVEEGGWAVTVSYRERGHVNDIGADKLDAQVLLAQILKANDARKSAGPRFVDWAQPPHYDQAHHALSSALEARGAGGGGWLLRYDIRMLGRRGVLRLSIVSPASSLEDVSEVAADLIEQVGFAPGARYVDVLPSDPRAAISLADLVLLDEGAKPDAIRATKGWQWVAGVGSAGLLIAVLGFIASRSRRRRLAA
jgi:uncharacterized membrane-anchored protein